MLGVYVHFPYCRSRCPYCDFAIHVRRTLPHRAYADAVIAELTARAPLFPGRRLASIYFGGGTPSLWEADEVARVITAVRARLATANVPLEITLEANPEDLRGETGARYLDALARAGVNRLSLGAQSFAPAQLVRLGRGDAPHEVFEVVASARRAGIANLSADLMYGLPDQTDAALDHDLEALCALDVPHLSIYQLTIEDHTPYAAYKKRGELTQPEEERLASMAETVERRTRDAGYTRYEISSYARPGHAAVHNALYWSGGEWLGLGMAAHSYKNVAADGPLEGGERWSNVRNVDRYLAAANAEVPDLAALDAARERLTETELAREALWLGLRRLDEGVEREEYVSRFGVDPVERYPERLRRLEAAGLLTIDLDRVRLTSRGALLADLVGRELL